MTQKKAAFPKGKRRFCLITISRRGIVVLGRPGSDLLSQGLSHSTIGAEEFNGRVRDGIGVKLLARTTSPAEDKKNFAANRLTAIERCPPDDPGEPHHKELALVRFQSSRTSEVLWTLKMRAIKPIERLVPV